MLVDRTRRRAVAAALVPTLIALLCSGCIFDTELSVTIFEFDESTDVFISTIAGTTVCDNKGMLGFECFFYEEPSGISRFFIESLPEFLNLLILIDPIVLQLPAEASVFAGSFLHQDSGTSGALSITSGLAAARVDDTRTLVAEPGTQIVVIELPEGAPTSGQFAFNFNFRMPAGTTEIPVKPLFTGRIELTDGGVFHAPLYPCRSDLAQVPEIVIPVPVPGGILQLPPQNPALLCDGEVYEYFGVQPSVPAALEIDQQASVADGNGVFEPGETVEVAPAWRNNDDAPHSLTGEASGFSGPPGATYQLVSDAAGYGNLDAWETASCRETGVCYEMFVDDPAVRPELHWDAVFGETLSDGSDRSWPLHLGESFFDVPTTNNFYSFIETIFHNGVTGGCGGTSYCPDNPALRKQMAVFLLKARYGAAYVPPAAVGIFGDVPAADPFAPWIEDLYNRSITGGCSAVPLNYCPDDTVLRQQMAVFLLKTLEGAAYTPPACTGVFADVACPGHPFADWIEELADREITGGCGGGNFCPASPNTRGQMAVFLTKTFGLPLYGP